MGELIDEGYCLAHNFKAAQGMGGHTREDAQILGVQEMADGTSVNPAYSMFCPTCGFVQLPTTPTFTSGEAYDILSKDRWYADMAKKGSRTHYLVWGMGSATKKEWDEMRGKSGEALSAKMRK